MNKDIKILLALVIPVPVLFATTLLLEWHWIQLLFERRLLVWLLLITELYVSWKIFKQVTN